MPRAVSPRIELEYETFGDGEPLLLVMGLGAQMILWADDFVASLVRRGFRVIRFDNRDTGLSTKISQRVGDPRKLMVRRVLGLPVPAPYTLRDMAEDAIGLLDHLGIERAHVVGASMGGMIAQTMAIHRPDRVRSLVSIMSSTGARRDLISKPKVLGALLRERPVSREHAIEGAVAFFEACGGTTHPPDRDWVRQTAGRAYDRAFNPAGFVRQLAAILASGSRRESLRSVSVPTTVIHGTDDPLILPHAGKATAAAIRGASFVPVRGMGHDLPSTTWPLVGDEIERLRDRAS
ncbi:MAG: alpha/beta fold hydrolase [Polyangiales bacterium]